MARQGALGNIGRVYADQGKLQEALKSHEKALATFKEIGNPLGRADVLMNIGRVYFNQDKKREALRVLKAARAIFQEVGSGKKLWLVEQMIEQVKTTLP